jgi:iron complex transport system permease protein
MLLGGIALLAVRWHLNPLSFGEEEAQAMGSETTKMRVIVIGACTLMTASAVAVAGIIGWVGLIIPHVARGLVGPDYGKLLPVSAVIGATYLLVIDDIARLAGPLELPLGILTALIGAPFFIFLLARTRRAWT